MITVWGRPESSNVAKVMWGLAEAGVASRRIDHGGQFGGNDTEEYRRLNPHGRIPTLVDGDVVLWESNSILRYIAARHAPALLPLDLVQRAHAEAWMDWCSITFGPRLKALRDRVKAGDEHGDLRREVTAMAGILDAAVAGRDYLTETGFGVADIALGGQVHRWIELQLPGAPGPDLPHLRKWRDRLLARPAFVTHVAGPIKL